MTQVEEIRKAAIEARCAVATSLSGDGYSSVDLLPDWVREDLSYDEFIEESFAKGTEWADKHTAKKHAVTLEAWVAKDKGSLVPWLYVDKPYSFYGMWNTEPSSEDDPNFDSIPLKYGQFPQITFENSPKKVKVTIELIEQ